MKLSSHGYFGKKTKKEYKEIIEQRLWAISDRGYISDEAGSYMMNIIYEYGHIIEDKIKEDKFLEAIRIIESCLEVIGELYIDGSNGEHGDIEDLFNEYTKEILEKSNKKEKAEFLKWLKEYIDTKDELGDYKNSFRNLYNIYNK